MSAPTVGRVVHYRRDADSPTPVAPCIAAIVTGVIGTRPTLTLLPSLEAPRAVTVAVSEYTGAGQASGSIGTWHWPERES